MGINIRNRAMAVVAAVVSLLLVGLLVASLAISSAIAQEAEDTDSPAQATEDVSAEEPEESAASGQPTEPPAVTPESDNAEDLEISEELDAEPVIAARDVSDGEYLPTQLQWDVSCSGWSTNTWSLKTNAVSSFSDNVKYIDHVDLRLPMSNSRRLQDFDKLRATINTGGKKSSHEVNLVETFDSPNRVYRFFFDKPIPAEALGRGSTVELSYVANISGGGAGGCPLQRKAAYNDVMPGAEVFYHGVADLPEGITPWDPNTDIGPSARLRVKVSSLRQGNEAAPLPGAQLKLHRADNPKVTRDPGAWGTPSPNDPDWGTPGSVIDEDWARCTVNNYGYCIFDVPAPEKARGVQGVTYWVTPAEAPDDYSAIDKLRVGFSGPNNPSGGIFSAFGSSHALDYAYRTPELFADDEVTSGEGDFMRFVRENQYTSVLGGAGEGVLYARSSSGQVVFRRDNPPLPDKCGLNIGILLDTSGSMGSSAFGGAKTSEVARQGLYDLVESLRGTGTKVGFRTFSSDVGTSNERYQIPEPILMDDAGVRRIQEISGNPRAGRRGSLNFSGATNWDDGLRAMGEHNERNSQNAYDVVIVITDGNPTRSAVPGQPGPGNAGDFAMIENAVLRANWLKGTAGGTRLIGIGVGAFEKGGVINRPEDKTISARNFNAVFGPVGDVNSNYPAIDVPRQDWITFNGRNEDQLGKALSDIAMAGCGAAVTVEKETQLPGEEVKKGGEGWHFEASGLSQGFTFEKQAGKKQVEGKTDKKSTVEFRLELDAPSRRNGTIRIAEDLGKSADNSGRWDIAKQGDPLRNAKCVETSAPGAPAVAVEDDGKYGFRLGGLKQGTRIHCKVLNVKQGTAVQLHKVDAENRDTVLDGAQFSIFPSNNKGEMKTSNPVPVNDAKFKVQPGFYGIVESKAPAGYSLLPAPVYIEVFTDKDGEKIRLVEKDSNGVLKPVSAATSGLIDLIDPASNNPTTEAVVSADEHGVFHINIADVTTGKLPKTGGHGVGLMGLIGVAIAVAGLLVGRRKTV